MALTEEKILSEITIYPETNTVGVKWNCIIKRDGEVISCIPHRKAYTIEQLEELQEEVEGYEKYVSAIGW